MKTTMKRLTGILLVLLLFCASALADGGLKLVNYHCDRDGFSTKIPLNALTDYRDDKGYMGMITYLNVPGFPPYVMAHRRPAEGRFKNPEGYLNNTYREFIEEKYPNDSVALNPARTWNIGGKELIGARYILTSKQFNLVTTQLQLIEIRDKGDVEYIAMYDTEEEEALVMAALDAIVSNYRED